MRVRILYNAHGSSHAQYTSGHQTSTMKLLIITMLVAYACADVSHVVGAKNAQILSQTFDMNPDGQYQWTYETDNGIAAREQGALKQVDKDNAAEVVQGEFGWTAPGGERVQLTYTADENGYQPQGAAIPVAPPIPDAILRALKYIQDHPPPPERR